MKTSKCSAMHETWEGGPIKVHTANKFDCDCVIDDSNTKQFCKVHGVIREDGKHPSGYVRWE